MLRADLTDLIVEILKNEYKIDSVDPVGLVTIPPDIQKGHLTTNAGLKYFKKMSEDIREAEGINSPIDFAERILERIKNIEKWKQYITSSEVVKPGFINIFFNNSYYIDILNEMLEKGSNIGKNDLYKGKKVIVEYTDPNPFKEFHIGHLMPNTIGESISRIVENGGAEVRRVCYQGDAGMHVAMSIWGIYKLLDEENRQFKDIEKLDLDKRIEFLGKSYARGAKAYAEESGPQEEIRELNYIIYYSAQKRLVQDENWTPVIDYKKYIKDTKYDLDEVYEVYYKGRSWSLEYFESLYKKLGTKFDGYYFESEVGEYGYKYVLENLDNGIFLKDDGAIIFPGEKYGLHNRVFINSHGLPTYEAKELGLAPKKYEDFKYDLSLIVTDNEIVDYFKVLLKALSLLRKDLADSTIHIAHGMLQLTSGRMSSRKGDVIKANDLINDIKSFIYETYILNRENKKETNENEVDIESLAVGSLKFSILKINIGKNIIYDPEADTSIGGDTSTYVNYVYARCCSILKTASDKPDKHKLSQNTKLVNKTDSAGLLSPYATSLMLYMSEYDEAVSRASTDLAPHYLVHYILELSRKFNKFYSEVNVLGNENESIYLNLCETMSAIVENCMNLLGIRLSKSM